MRSRVAGAVESAAVSLVWALFIAGVALSLLTLPVFTATVFVPLNVPPPALFWMAKVTFCAVPVTVFPPASCNVTTGWTERAEPPVPFPGCVVNESLAAAPAVTLKALLTTTPGVVFTVLPVAVRV